MGQEAAYGESLLTAPGYLLAQYSLGTQHIASDQAYGEL